jgi:hypothetical protein
MASSAVIIFVAVAAAFGTTFILSAAWLANRISGE